MEPDLEKQIIATHAGLIRACAQAAREGSADGVRDTLDQMAEDGWEALVATLDGLIAGEAGDTDRLDEEDRVIVAAVQRGIEDPATLPDPDAAPDPAQAAPMIAAMVFEATRGEHEALEAVAAISASLENGAGDNPLGERLIRMVEGERDHERLAEGIGGRQRQLLGNVLSELQSLEAG